MDINENTIEKVANLARLNLTEQEKVQFTKDLKEILQAFEKIDKLDVSNTEPSFHPIKIKGHLREDLPSNAYSREELLSLTKNKTDEYFKGPKVKK